MSPIRVDGVRGDGLALIVWYIMEVWDAPLDLLVDRLGQSAEPEARLRIREHVMTTAETLRTHGIREIVVRLLEKKFGLLPAPLGERVCAATRAELESWADRLLTASTLDEVFEPT